MSRFCERCERPTQDGNMWCPERDCPAEANYDLHSYGEYIGDIKVVKLLRAWRTAAIYEAERNGEKVLLKVAQPGDDCADRLRREAVALASLAPKPSKTPKFIQGFMRPAPRSVLLEPIAPYQPAPNKPYGEITFRDKGKVYSAYKYVSGKFLSDLLLENPQIWHYEVAWVIMTVADALRPLVANKKTHLGLHPDVILVDTDKEGHLRPTLLDLGFLLEGDEIRSVPTWLKLSEPGYTAPELLAQGRTAHPAADVFSMGLIYYEMLAGHPGYETKVDRDELVRRMTLQARHSLDVDRPELDPAGVVKIVERAVSPNNRFANVLELAADLKKIYSNPPPEKRPLPIRTRILFIVLGIILAIALIAVIVLVTQTLLGMLASRT